MTVARTLDPSIERARGRRSGTRGAPGWLWPVGLWLFAAVVSGFTIRRLLEPFDEGLLMQAASRMAAGEWPWRDFGWAYGPGQPLVVAAAFKVLAPSVWWWRILRVLVDATTAVLVWALVRSGRPAAPAAGERWALPAGIAAALTAAQPVSANPTSAALALALGAVLLAVRRRPVWAGVLAALAAAWRPDLGAAAAVATVAALWDGVGARPADAPTPGGRRLDPGLGRAIRSLAAAVVAGALVYAPFVVAAGPGRVWDALVVQAGRDGAWWRLPFPAPYPGRLRPWPPGALGQDLKDVVGWITPYVALVACLAAVVVLVARRRSAVGSGPGGASAGLGVLALGAFAYFHSRADEFHAQALLLVACALIPLAGSAAPRRLAVAFAAALALIGLAGAANRLSALLRPPELVSLHLPGAQGIQVPAAEARALPVLVATVQQLVPPGRPVYVAPLRSDRVAVTDPLLHFLVRRPNVLRRDVLLQARPAEQAAIVAALRRARPRVVIRWLDPLSARPEPNLRGRSTGVRTLDAYLARAYRPAARYGVYQVLVPRG